MRLLLMAFLVLTSVLKVQSCNNHPFIPDSGKIEVKKGATWFKFKAKGAKLQLNLKLDSLDGEYYTIYPFTSCDSIKFKTPIRSTKKGVSALTEEIWEQTLKTGSCFCDQCLSKINVDFNNKLTLEQERFYLLKVVTKAGNKPYAFRWSSIDPSKKKFELGQSTQGLEVGMLYQLKEVRFTPNSTRYLGGQIPNELDSLGAFLKRNSNIKVNIVGHVNGPGSKDPSFQKLSEARAAKIKKHLLNYGIAMSRLVSIGMGNTQMRYPSPKEEWQAVENRRVEVVITGL